LEELGQKATLVVNFEKKTAALNYDLEVIEGLKVKREDGAADTGKREGGALDTGMREDRAADTGTKEDVALDTGTREGGAVNAGKWLWYWKEDDDTWKQYTTVCQFSCCSPITA